MIFPNSKVKQFWDIWIVFLLVYTALIVPYKVCFEDTTSDSQFVFDLLVDASFLIDITLTFFTAYEERGVLIVNRTQIAKNYLKSWFVIDVVTTIPFQLLEKLDSTSNDLGVSDSKALRLARIPRLYRLLRIFRLLRILKLMKKEANSSKSQMAKAIKLGNSIKEMLTIISTIIFTNHLVACLWFFQAKLLDFPDNCWVRKEDIIDEDASRQYLISFYWAFQTLLTIGYGDISVSSDIEKIAAIIWMIAGVGFYSYTIGNMVQMIQNFDIENQELQNNIEILKNFNTRANLSSRLYHRIVRHLQNQQIQNKFAASEKLLAELPINLRDQIVNKTHGEVFKKIKFF